MNRPWPIDRSGWWHGNPPPPPDLTADDYARLLHLRERIARGLVDEQGPEIRRWAFVRWAWKRGLFDG